MALFGKTTAEETPAPSAKPVPAAATAPAEKRSVRESPLAERYLIRPRITEKAYALNRLNQYVFQVTKNATKSVVRRAVEEAYGVSVASVHIVRLPAKRRASGQNRRTGLKSPVKKAIVTVGAGQSLELFKGGI